MPGIEDIDPDDETILVVGSGLKNMRFRVSRFAMRLASPVWKAIFTSAFVDATEDEIDLPGDMPDGMRILLLFIHLQFKRLPTEPSLAEIASLAQLCDQYDCAAIAEDRV